MAAKKKRAMRKAAPKRKPARRAANNTRAANPRKIGCAAGRPTEFRKEFSEQARKLCELGATDQDLADFFEVSARTIYRWQSQHPEFCHALKAGKDPADARVERSLFHRAVGYSHEAVKIFMPASATEPVLVEYREQVPPDTTAAIFWLKNRKPELWRDRSQLEHTGRDGGPIETKSRSDLEVARRIAFLLTQAKKG